MLPPIVKTSYGLSQNRIYYKRVRWTSNSPIRSKVTERPNASFSKNGVEWYEEDSKKLNCKTYCILPCIMCILIFSSKFGQKVHIIHSKIWQIRLNHFSLFSHLFLPLYQLLLQQQCTLVRRQFLSTQVRGLLHYFFQVLVNAGAV